MSDTPLFLINKGEKTMEIKTIKYLMRMCFVLMLMLIINHWFRGLVWWPLCILLIPTYGMLVIAEKADND